ncbi:MULTISPECIES: restriction endonuclease subunit S [Henriciella]|jgi:type I restriction enzyme, S subunit|uniref:restriction endonuclease subunit S n=1 Tax=Henriciella TaxID=453849 RepID=UPI0035119971
MVAAAVQERRATEDDAPKGFKQTEIGVLPEDWKVVALGETLAEAPRYGVNLAGVARSGSLPTYLRITDFNDDGVLNEQGLVSVDCHPAEQNSLLNGDLVVARTGASTGRTFHKTYSSPNFVFAGFLIRLRPDHKRIDSAYLEAVTRTAYYRKWVKENSQRSGQPGINGRQLATLPIPLPPLPEQEAISGALSDADRAVRAVERLIEKKRAVKQAALHALLTPTTRLPGFDGDWETKTLGELVSIKAGEGITSLSISEAGSFKCYGGNGLRGYTERWTHEGVHVLIGRVGALCGNINLADGQFFASEHALVLSHNALANPVWLSYVLSQYELGRMSEASAQPVLTAGKLKQVEISVPPLTEQRAIAAILSDMDAEIAALEARRDKLKAVKQGMMQSLLTGKVRLV